MENENDYIPSNSFKTSFGDHVGGWGATVKLKLY